MIIKYDKLIPYNKAVIKAIHLLNKTHLVHHTYRENKDFFESNLGNENEARVWQSFEINS